MKSLKPMRIKRMTNLKPMKSRKGMKSRRLKKNFKPMTSLEWTEKHRPMQKLTRREPSHTKNPKPTKQRNLLNDPEAMKASKSMRKLTRMNKLD